MPDWNPDLPQMPVDEHGNWMDYPQRVHHWETVHEPFYAEFVIDGMRTGRSSKKVILHDIKTDRYYPMFVSDMVKGISQGTFTVEPRSDGGRLIGYWTGSKRGANYGIKAVNVQAEA